MKLNITISLATMLFLTTHFLFAQEAELKHDGVVFPTMSAYPPSPDIGQVIYFTGVNPAEYRYYSGSSWNSLGSSTPPASWKIEDLQDQNTAVYTIDGNPDFIQMNIDGLGSNYFRIRPSNDIVMEPSNIITYNTLIGRGAGLDVTNTAIGNTYLGDSAGRLNVNGDDNTYMGRSAGYSNLNGSKNTHIGRRAGFRNLKDNNVALGYFAGSNSDNSERSIFIGSEAGESAEGNDNVFIGYQSGERSDQGGDQNVAVGNGALKFNGNNKTATNHSRYNVAVGHQAGQTNDLGYNNVFVGRAAGTLNSDGFNNSFFGYAAGDNNISGHHNTYIGDNAASNNSAGQYNTMVGSSVGTSSSGNDNTFLGTDSGRNNAGSGNVFIGNEAGWNINGGAIQDVSNTLIITNDRDKQLIYGEFDNDIVRVDGEMQIESNQINLRNLGGTDNNRGIIFSEDTNPAFGFVYDGVGSGSENRLHFREYLGTQTDVMTMKGNGNVGIGLSNPAVKLDVNGTIRGTSVFCGGINACSDIRLKKDFEPIDSPIETIKQLKGYYHFWKDEEFPEWQFSKEREIGFKAQDMQAVLPEIVEEMPGGMLSIDYSKLTPVLVEAIKAQQKMIDELHNEIKQMKQ